MTIALLIVAVGAIAFLMFYKKKKNKLMYPHRDNWGQWHEFEKQLLHFANEKRKQNGKRMMVADETLYLEAEGRAIHYRKLGKLDKHIGVSAVFRRLKDLGARSPAENLAYGYSTAEKTVEAWMKSEKHRRILLSGRAIYCGMSVAKSASGRTYICMLVCR